MWVIFWTIQNNIFMKWYSCTIHNFNSLIVFNNSPTRRFACNNYFQPKQIPINYKHWFSCKYKRSHNINQITEDIAQQRVYESVRHNNNDNNILQLGMNGEIVHIIFLFRYSYRLKIRTVLCCTYIIFVSR